MNIFKLVYLLLNTMQNLEVNLYKEKLNMLKQDLKRGLITESIYERLSTEYIIALRLNGYELSEIKPLKSRIYNFIMFRYPLAIFHNAIFIILAIIIYGLGFIIGSSFPVNLSLNPEVNRQYSSIILFIQILMNNLRVQGFALALSILADVPTILTAFINGFILGLVYSSYNTFNTLKFWSLILPHGTLELTAILTSFGASLGFGYRFLKNYSTYGSRYALRKAASDAINVSLGGSILLFFAALIESFFTPSPIDPIIKIIFALIVFLIVIIYLTYSWLRIRKV